MKNGILKNPDINAKGILTIHAREKIFRNSDAGDREIAVHRMIEPIIRELWKDADPHLFMLPRCKSHRTRQHTISACFQVVLKEMGIKTPLGEDLYSCRKAFQHALQDVEPDRLLREEIFGHKHERLIEEAKKDKKTGRSTGYGKLYSIEQVNAAIQKMSFPGITAPLRLVPNKDRPEVHRLTAWDTGARKRAPHRRVGYGDRKWVAKARQEYLERM